MSITDRWLLPDGVDELLPPEAWSVEILRRAMLDVFARYGYELVAPPLIEFLESLLTGTGNNLDLQTFKLTDQLTGRLMGLRADITPQIARIDSRACARGRVNRFCYVDTVLRTRPPNMLATRTPLQIGCELFGEPGQSADLEIISVMLEILQIAGVERVHIDLEHVGIFKGLVEWAVLSKSEEDRLLDALSRKSVPDLEHLAGEEGQQAGLIQVICDIARLSSGHESLQRIRDQVRQLSEDHASIPGLSMVLGAIDELESIALELVRRFPKVETGFDFCELRGYNYHTGILFAAYTPGNGQALAKGGRYDDVGKDFGESRPATGFSADLKILARLAHRHGEHPTSAVLAPAGNDPELLRAIESLRRDRRVIQLLGSECASETYGCSHRLACADGTWQVVEI
jgi:ATP phosphoribosyltransferase regulatory subunit